MNRPDIEKLLGGYATGTLNAEERRALYEAALEDQQLFKALLREEPLRELLADPAARSQLLAALGPKTRFAWLRRPAMATLAAGLAVAAAVLVILLPARHLPARRAVQTAHILKETAASAPAPVPAPGPEAAQPPETRSAAKAAGKLEPSKEARAVPPPARESEQLAAGALGGASPAARELYHRSSFPQMSLLRAEADSQPPASALTRRQAAAPSAPAANLGLRYSILIRDAGGAYVPANPSGEFHSNDWLRLLFEPNDAGYLYVLQHESSGGWRLLFGGPVQAHQRCSVPESGALTYPQPGTKQLFVILARQPQPEMAEVQTARLEALAVQGRDTQLIQRVENENAIYAVSVGPPSPLQRLALEIRIEIR